MMARSPAPKHWCDGPIPLTDPSLRSKFIPLIVQAGQIGKLTRFVFQRAAEAAMMFRDAGFDIPVAINLTPRDLLDVHLVDDLAGIIDAVAVDPSLLAVEITEDAMVVDFDTSIHVLAQLRELGLKLAIDDFGTGYSSLQHLHRLPVDTLKIDRSFISRLTTNDSAHKIVRASINLATDLRLGTIAEGIEDDETLRAIAQLGCDEMQGYLVCRPVPATDFVRWARSWQPEQFAARTGVNQGVRSYEQTRSSTRPVGLMEALSNLAILDYGSRRTGDKTLWWWDLGVDSRLAAGAAQRRPSDTPTISSRITNPSVSTPSTTASGSPRPPAEAAATPRPMAPKPSTCCSARGRVVA